MLVNCHLISNSFSNKVLSVFWIFLHDFGKNEEKEQFVVISWHSCRFFEEFFSFKGYFQKKYLVRFLVYCCPFLEKKILPCSLLYFEDLVGSRFVSLQNPGLDSQRSNCFFKSLLKSCCYWSMIFNRHLNRGLLSFLVGDKLILNQLDQTIRNKYSCINGYMMIS